MHATAVEQSAKHPRRRYNVAETNTTKMPGKHEHEQVGEMAPVAVRCNVTCFTGGGGGRYGWRPTSNVIHSDHIKLVLGVWAERTYHIKHGYDAANLAECLLKNRVRVCLETFFPVQFFRSKENV